MVQDSPIFVLKKGWVTKFLHIAQQICKKNGIIDKYDQIVLEIDKHLIVPQVRNIKVVKIMT